MGFGPQRHVEDLARFLVQELRVLGVDDEPAQLRRKRLDQADVVDKASQEGFTRHAVVARGGGVGDEVAALEALLQRALVGAGRAVRAGRNYEEQQGGPRAHGGNAMLLDRRRRQHRFAALHHVRVVQRIPRRGEARIVRMRLVVTDVVAEKGPRNAELGVAVEIRIGGIIRLRDQHFEARLDDEHVQVRGPVRMPMLRAQQPTDDAVGGIG